MSQHPGRVVTADKLVSLVAEAWPHSFTSVNIISYIRARMPPRAWNSDSIGVNGTDPHMSGLPIHLLYLFY